MVAFGGDEVSALVYDFGTRNTKIGFAGEETPRHIYPSFIGTDQSNKKIRGTNQLLVTRENCELKNPFQDGLVSDWDLLEELWSYSNELLDITSTEHPVLFSDPAWDTKQNREKLCELAFEKFNLPGFYLGRSAVLSAFAAGRSTALVIDSGASNTSVVPVFDGYIVKKGIQKAQIGGDFITDQCLQYLQSKGIDLTPQCLIASKQPRDSTLDPIFTKKPITLTESYADFHRYRTIHDFKEIVLNVPESGYNERDLKRRPLKNYEFPTGYNNLFGLDRFKLAESLFLPGFVLNPPPGTVPVTIPQLITTSILACDADLQPFLHTNAVLTGANSLLHGFADRVYSELHRTTPGGRIKVQAAGGSSERKYGAWIGGSILSSLSSFHQLWISKAQYEEVGSSVEKKIY